jgi:hypothetical protein
MSSVAEDHMSREHAGGPIENRTCMRDEEMTELSLLLPSWQVVEMEGEAHSRGLTLGQLIRLLVRDYLADRPVLAESVSISKQQ